MLSGDFHSPKLFENDGKVGDIYYAPGESCFFRLKNAGVPGLRRWTYPRFGQSNENWEFINQRTGTYQNPKLMGDVGEPNEIYYCPVVNLYFIAKNHGVKSIECCPFPTDGGDNEHWIVAGSHQGSQAQPKNWAEYGQPDSIYYKNGHGYFSLLKQGRPSEHNWAFPPYGQSNDYWQPVGLQQGIFTQPRKETEYGVKGDIYFSSLQRAYFALKRDGNPSESGWIFPTKFKDDDNWVFAGMHKGTLANPKIGNEYGKVGSIYPSFRT